MFEIEMDDEFLNSSKKKQMETVKGWMGYQPTVSSYSGEYLDEFMTPMASFFDIYVPYGDGFSEGEYPNKYPLDLYNAIGATLIKLVVK